jgi:BioD-like phosphotransacetylase family protein
LVALYVTSSVNGSGQTTVSAGLGRLLLGHGRKVGFLKPVIADSQNQPGQSNDSDTILMKHLLAIEESADLLGPVFRDESDLKNGIKKAYAAVSAGKDVIIIEGPFGQAPSVVEALDARAMVIEVYSPDLAQTLASHKNFGRRLLGVVINKVPRSRLEAVRSEMAAQLAGVKILGIMPEDRALLSLTVSELAERIHGEILRGAGKAAELVENIMLGAMYVDSGLDYFGRQANKAVVLKSDRPDMQLAALETSTRCLVLAGKTAPIPAVLARAEDQNVPIITVKDNVATVVANIESALIETRFSAEKLPRLTEIMGRHFDSPSVYQGLGLAN